MELLIINLDYGPRSKDTLRRHGMIVGDYEHVERFLGPSLDQYNTKAHIREDMIEYDLTRHTIEIKGSMEDNLVENVGCDTMTPR